MRPKAKRNNKEARQRYRPVAFYLILAFIVVKPLAAQEIREDTLHVAEVSEHSSRTAVIRSSLLPGWGQLYNGQKFKAALVVAGELGLAAAAVVQNQRAVRATSAYERDFYRDDRSRFIWYAAALWLINIMDAYVDAQLYDFDVGGDLSLEPVSRPDMIAGLRLGFRF